MKIGLVTKLDKRNKTMSKKLSNNVMSKNCDLITIFPIFGQFGEIRKPDSGRIVVKLTKTENKTKRFLTQLLHYCFE